MTPALWTIGVGLVLLALLVPLLLRRVRRFDAARDALRGALVPRVAALRSLAAARPRRR